LWQAKVPEMAQRVFRRYMKMDPDMVEDYIEYLVAHGQWNEAATLLAHALNRESFQSKKVSFPAPDRLACSGFGSAATRRVCEDRYCGFTEDVVTEKPVLTRYDLSETRASSPCTQLCRARPTGQ